MNICGIICEYNPFHNGHVYHIQQTREKFGATHIVAVMSGNFTQRGDLAIIDKFKRAEVALKNGVDLVIELPVAFAMGSAEQFAQGAVHLLNSLGCVNMLSFGSECGDIKLLREAAGAVVFAEETDDLKGAMRNGYSYPAALQRTIEKYYENDVIETLTSPNNTLAIEYFKALNASASEIKPVTVTRKAAPHDSHLANPENIVSASQLRKMIAANEDYSALIPGGDFSNITSIQALELPILSKIRTMSKAELEMVPNVMLGLENRIYKAARVSTTLGELMCLIKTKRYTLARIRRIVLAAYLGIRKSDLKNPPAYVRILGMNSAGKEILAAASCDLPINTSFAKLAETSVIAKKQTKLEERCDNQYALSLEKRAFCGTDFTSKPIILD